MATALIPSPFDIDTQDVLNILDKFLRRYDTGLWGKERATWSDFKAESVPPGRIFITATPPHVEGELGVLRNTAVVVLESSPRKVEATLLLSTRAEREAALRESNLAPDLLAQMLEPDPLAQVVAAQWYSLEPFFNHLVAYFRQELRAGTQSPAPAEPPTARRRGRKRDTNYDWAYQQMAVNRRPRERVFKEWVRRIGRRADGLVDPRGSFNKAINRRAKSISEGEQVVRAEEEKDVKRKN